MKQNRFINKEYELPRVYILESILGSYILVGSDNPDDNTSTGENTYVG